MAAHEHVLVKVTFPVQTACPACSRTFIHGVKCREAECSIFVCEACFAKYLQREEQKRSKKLHWTGEIALDFASELLSQLFNPMQVLEVHRTCQFIDAPRAHPADTVLGAAALGRYEVFTTVWARHGLAGLYRGATIAAMKRVVAHAIKDKGKQLIKKTLAVTRDDPPSKAIICTFAAATLAPAFELAIQHPFEVVRTNVVLDIAGTRFPTIFTCVDHLYRAHGVRGFFAGASAAMVGVFVYRFAYFSLYHFIRSSVLPRILHDSTPPNRSSSGTGSRQGEDSSPTPPSNVQLSYPVVFMIGWGCTIVAGVVANPLSVVARTMMVTNERFLPCFTRIVKEYGYSALFSGAGAKIIDGIAGSILLAAADHVKSYLVKRQQHAVE